MEEALYYHLKLLPSSPPVAWPGKNFRPVDGVRYLRPKYLPNVSDYAAIGINSPKRHRGFFQVEVRGPLDGGITDSTIAENIIDHFEGEVINYQGVRVRIGSFDGSPGLPYRTSSFADGAWLVTPVSIPWWSDEF